MGNLYRPRAYAELYVPLFGSTAEKQRQITDTGAVTIPLRVRRWAFERNDHNHADTCSIEVEERDAGVDPRQLANARGQLWVGNANNDGQWSPSRGDLRFVGIMTRAGRRAGGGQGMSVSLEFVDYTSFFLNQKSFPVDGTPSLSDTLADAWRKICDNVGYYDLVEKKVVSSVSDLKDALVFRGAGAQKLESSPIGKATSPRLRKAGKIAVKHGADAWAVWSQCCGMLGLITYFDLDSVIITEATDLYTLDNPPRLVWGQNILEWNEEAGSGRAHKGVGITSYDPASNTLLEAFYPLPGDPRIRQKRTPAKKAYAAQTAIQSENYEMFAVPGISDQGTLERIAQRAFEEYGRQQIEGTLTTVEMSVDRNDGSAFDLLSLGAGEALKVELQQDEIKGLAQLQTEGERIDYLVGRGYSTQTATLMAKNFESFLNLSPTYHAKCVRAQGETTPEGGSFQVSVTYVNLIDPFGGAAG